MEIKEELNSPIIILMKNTQVEIRAETLLHQINSAFSVTSQETP